MVLASLPAHGAMAEPHPLLPTTTAPIVYSIDYSDRYFTTPAYVQAFYADPPDLLHVGKAVPISHLWGPIPLYAGENQYTGGAANGLSLENVTLLTPEQNARPHRDDSRDARSLSCSGHS